MPEKAYKEVLAGGITLKKHGQADQNKSKKGMTINNEFQYVIGVVLHQETDKVLSLMDMKDVDVHQINARNTITGNLHNEQNKFMHPLNVAGEVRNSNNKVNYQKESSNWLLIQFSHILYCYMVKN